MANFTGRIDRRMEKSYLARYRPDAVDRIVTLAAATGARAAAKVMKEKAPVGTSTHLSQYYRRNGLQHGAFRASVTARKIRARGDARGKTIGYVVGPIGKNAFTRAWIEFGTARGERANPWVEAVADAALTTAREDSEAVLELYSRV